MLNTETVLLVDDDDPEGGVFDLFLDQGMRADDDVDLAGDQIGEDLASIARRHAVREQLDPQRALAHERARVRNRQVAEHGGHAGVMLFGEHFGGSHQRTLIPTLHRREERVHRHQCLAGTNIALQKTMHGSGEFEIRTNLTDRPLLRVGERERQPFDEAVGELTGDLVGDTRRLPLDTTLATNQLELHPQQLVEHEPAAGLSNLGHRFRLMDTEHGGGPIDKVETVEHAIRNGIVKAAGSATGDRLLDKSSEVLGEETGLLRLGIHGDDPAGLVTHEVDDRAGHLTLTLERVALAVDQHAHAGGELFLSPPLVEEGQPELMPSVTDHDFGERAPASELPGPTGAHLADDRRLLARLEIADRCLSRAVEMTSRIVREQIKNGADLGTGEGGILLVTDTAQARDGNLVEIPQGEWRIALWHAVPSERATRARSSRGRAVGRPRAPRPRRPRDALRPTTRCERWCRRRRLRQRSR